MQVPLQPYVGTLQGNLRIGWHSVCYLLVGGMHPFIMFLSFFTVSVKVVPSVGMMFAGFREGRPKCWDDVSRLP